MASGNVSVIVGYDKKSLKELRKLTKKLEKCYDTLVQIKECMERLKLKRMPKEGRLFVWK